MSSVTLTVVIIVVVIAVLVLGLVSYRVAKKKRTERLRAQFGPEYERAVRHADSQDEAESELRQRTKQHDQLELRQLAPDDRERYERRWTQTQADFVDDPSRAVRDADALVVEVMSARGYPVEDFDQRADVLSVEHPKITRSYREARKISQANEAGTADTEDLRHAVTSYRELVHALLADGDDHATTNSDNPDRTTEDRTTEVRTTEKRGATAGPGSAAGPAHQRAESGSGSGDDVVSGSNQRIDHSAQAGLDTGRDDMGKGARDL